MSRLIYSIPDLLMLEEDRNRWIIENMIPTIGKTIIFGKGSTYKTTFTFDLCVAIASNTPLFRLTRVRKSCKVLLISSEGSLYDNKRRLEMHIKTHRLPDPSGIPLLFCQEAFLLDEEEDIAELESLIDLHRPGVLVIDPLDSAFAGDENSAKETKLVRRTLDRIAHKFRLSCIILHHANKRSNELRGSSAWFDWADCVINFCSGVNPHNRAYAKQLMDKDNAVPRDEVRRLVTISPHKVRNGRLWEPYIGLPCIDSFLGECHFSFIDKAGSTEHIALDYWRRRCYEFLVERQKGGPTAITPAQLKDGLKSPKPLLDKVLAELQRDQLIMESATARAAGHGHRNVHGYIPLCLVDTVDYQSVMLKHIYERESGSA